MIIMVILSIFKKKLGFIRWNWYQLASVTSNMNTKIQYDKIKEKQQNIRWAKGTNKKTLSVCLTSKNYILTLVD